MRVDISIELIYYYSCDWMKVTWCLQKIFIRDDWKQVRNLRVSGERSRLNSYRQYLRVEFVGTYYDFNQTLDPLRMVDAHKSWGRIIATFDLSLTDPHNRPLMYSCYRPCFKPTHYAFISEQHVQFHKKVDP